MMAQYRLILALAVVALATVAAAGQLAERQSLHEAATRLRVEEAMREGLTGYAPTEHLTLECSHRGLGQALYTHAKFLPFIETVDIDGLVGPDCCRAESSAIESPPKAFLPVNSW